MTALDAPNDTVTTYAGTVHFTSSDSQAVLPVNSMLTNGVGTFPATLETTGSQTITATDIFAPTITGVSSTIQVSIAAPAGTFTATGSMEFARAEHTATLLKDGTVLIIGGGNATGPLASVEIFNPATGICTLTIGQMETARAGHTATLLTDGTVLVTGGNDATGALATAEIFSPATGMFTPTTGQMETARAGHTATLLNDGTGRVLVAGGGPPSAELFDPKSGQFTPVSGDMLANMSTATLLPGGEVLLEGGSAQGDLFSPSTATFTATASGGAIAGGLVAALPADGKVLLAGGEVPKAVGPSCYYGPSAVQVTSSDAFLFNSSSATFSETGGMSNSRASHTATLLSGGDVLIAGGTSIIFEFCDRGLPRTTTTQALATAELYNPESETFAPTHHMTAARAGHTATLLANGTEVLLVGVSTLTAMPSRAPSYSNSVSARRHTDEPDSVRKIAYCRQAQPVRPRLESVCFLEGRES